MGNAANNVSKALEPSEYMSGKKLLNGIKANSPDQIEAAIEICKKERIQGNSGTNHEKQYDVMHQKMTNYLTGKYDIGDGVIFKKTPLEYAKSLANDEAVRCLERAIRDLEMTENKDKMTKTVGLVTSDRAATAKDRLREFQKTR